MQIEKREAPQYGYCKRIATKGYARIRQPLRVAAKLALTGPRSRYRLLPRSSSARYFGAFCGQFASYVTCICLSLRIP